MNISDDCLEPVFHAVKEGNLEDVKNLLAPLEISARTQLCFVMLATEEEQPDIVKFFLQSNFIYTCDALKEIERTPLHIAVEKENLEIIEMILEKMHQAHDILKTSTSFSAKLMRLVISKGNKNVLELLLNYHDPCIAVQKISGPFKAIHLAVEKDHVGTVALLLQGGVSVDCRYPSESDVYDGCTILHRAVQLNFTALTELLLESGADVNAECGSVLTVFPKAAETETLQEEESVVGIADSDAKSTAEQSETSEESDERRTEKRGSVSMVSFAGVETVLTLQDKESDMRIADSDAESTGEESETSEESDERRTEKRGSVSMVSFAGVETVLTLQDKESDMQGIADSDTEATGELSETSGESYEKPTVENVSNLSPITFSQVLSESGANFEAGREGAAAIFPEAAASDYTLQDTESMHDTTDSDIESTADQSDIFDRSDEKQTTENSSNSSSMFGAHDTPLHVAVKTGNKQLVKLLLEFNANVDAQDSQAKTVLHLAVEAGCPKIVTHVLNYCPSADHAGNKAAFYISQLNDGKIAKELRCYFTRFYPDATNNFELLYNAVRTNYFQLAQKLIKQGANVQGTYEGRNVRFKGRTLLHVAAVNGTGRLIKLLLDNGAEPDVKNTKSESPLLVAIQNANLAAARHLFPATKTNIRNEPEHFITALEGSCSELVELCIQYGAHVNKWVNYPLKSAGFRSFDDMVHQFISGKKKKAQEPDDETWKCLKAYRRRMAGSILGLPAEEVKPQEFIKTTPLCIAAMAGCPKVVETVLKYSPEILFVEFHFAVLFDRRAVVQVLIDRETNFDCNMANFGTLVWCAEAGHVEMLELLIKSGANVDQKREKDGKSALHVAVSQGSIEVVKLLLSYGAEVDVEDNKDQTPLFTAVETYRHNESHERLATVKELLNFGASVECENSEGRSVLLSAVLTDQPQPLRTLLEYGSVDMQYVSASTVRGLLEGLKKVSNDSNHTLFYKDSIQTADILIFHTVKMKAAGLYRREEKFEPKFHVDNAKREDFWRKCCAEVAEMKLEYVGETDVTFYEIFTKDLANLARFVKNRGLLPIIGSEYCKTKFPIYGGLLKNQLEKGEVRKQLLERATHVCLSLCSCSLTFEIVEKIQSYLSSRDLRTVIQAGNLQKNSLS